MNKKNTNCKKCIVFSPSHPSRHHRHSKISYDIFAYNYPRAITVVKNDTSHRMCSRRFIILETRDQ